MKLSIIVPCYNVESYISDCLYSFLPYMTDEVELIIVDDCSTDMTVNRARVCIMMYSLKNITLIVNPKNCGVSHARNCGLKHAKGKYVAFIDGDDFVNRKYVSMLLQCFKDNSDYYILSWAKTDGEVFSARALPSWNKSVWSRVFKKDIITNEFDESLSWGEDAKFIDENIARRHKFSYIDDVMYYYRWKRPNSITSIRLGR